MEYVNPKYKLDAFNCPYCNAYADQQWYNTVSAQNKSAGYNLSGIMTLSDFEVCSCRHCKKISIWHLEKMIYPNMSTAPMPSIDLPSDCVEDYNEAREIFGISPKASSALLRLVLQKLCIYLGETGRNINDDIANLVKKGLPPGVQKALDLVRVVGNNAVHPGIINIDDNPEIAFMLFKLINIIVENMITRQKEIDELYKDLPESTRNAIDQRDS